MIKSLKDTPYWNIWADCCQLHKKFFGCSETDDTGWIQLTNDAVRIRDKYKNTPEGEFAEQMVLLITAEINKRAKEEPTNATKKQTQHTAEQP